MILSKAQTEALSAYILKHGTKKEDSEVLDILGKKFFRNESPKEEELMGEIERHGNKLTCFNCEKALSDVGVAREGQEKLIAELCFEPGESNYPREPDVPATIYFVCGECVGEREDRRCILLDKASVKAALIDRMEQDGLPVQSGSYLDKRVEDFYLFVDDALRGFLDDQYHMFVEEAEI